MENIETVQPPIGAVVRKLDLLFSNIERKTEKYGSFKRLEWQFLNLLKEKHKVKEAEVYQFLSFFDNSFAIQQTIGQFVNYGFVTESRNEISITPEGEKAYEEALQIQQEVRQKAMDGIKSEDYFKAISTLEKIYENLQDFLPEGKSAEANDAQSITEEMEAVKAIIQQVEKAHNEKNPELMAGVFREDAVFVNGQGLRLIGKEAIYNSARRVLATILADSFAKYEVADAKLIGPGVAIAAINQKPISKSGEPLPEAPEGRPTYILVKDRNEGWKVVAAQNTLAAGKN